MFQVLENFSFIYPLLCTPCKHVLHSINHFCIIWLQVIVFLALILELLVCVCWQLISSIIRYFITCDENKELKENVFSFLNIKKNKLPDTLYISVHVTSMTVVSAAILHL